MCPTGTFVSVPGRHFKRTGTKRRWAARLVRGILDSHRRDTVPKRLLFFVYGATCYLIFLATFLYAIAFVGGFAVPTRLDDDPQGSFVGALMIDCPLLTLCAA